MKLLLSMLVAAVLLISSQSSLFAQPMSDDGPKFDKSVTAAKTTTKDGPGEGKTETTVEPVESKGNKEIQKTTEVEKDKDGNITKKTETTNTLEKGLREVGTTERTISEFKPPEKEPHTVTKRTYQWDRAMGADGWKRDEERLEREEWANNPPRWLKKKTVRKLKYKGVNIEEGTKTTKEFKDKDDKEGKTTEEVWDKSSKKFVPKP